MSAARRKGQWVGGTPVLGYDVDPQGGRLVVNPAEAERVREIFAISAGCASLAAAQKQVHAHGLVTKDWTSKSGKHHSGCRLTQSRLDALLRQRGIPHLNERGRRAPFISLNREQNRIAEECSNPAWVRRKNVPKQSRSRKSDMGGPGSG